MTIRQLVLLADTHVGSTVGLLPPGVVNFELNEIGLNPVQDWLWRCWESAQAWLATVTRNDPYALVLNGDLIEGAHHKTVQVISPDTKDHVSAAVQLLQPLAAKAAKTFLTQGTEVHSRNSEDDIGRALSAERDGERYVFEKLHLTVAGFPLVIQHHISTTTRAYLEASALSIHLGNEQQHAIRNGEPPPRGLICAHRHTYGYYENHSGFCLVTPPWQALTRYGMKVVPAARTNPGIVVLDWRNREDGEMPDVHVRTYRQPPRPTVKI